VGRCQGKGKFSEHKNLLLSYIYPEVQASVGLRLITSVKEKLTFISFPGLMGVKPIFFSHFSPFSKVMGPVELFSSK